MSGNFFERGRSVSPCDAIVAFSGCPGHVRLLSVALVLFSLLSPIRSFAESIILDCSYAEVLTGTNGNVKHYSVKQTIKIGSGVYQAWSSKHGEWGENQCNRGTCTFDNKVFSYELNDVNGYDGYVLADTEQLTIDRAIGRLIAEKKTSTTTALTGYQTETTWYDDGTCVSGTDPAAALKKN